MLFVICVYVSYFISQIICQCIYQLIKVACQVVWSKLRAIIALQLQFDTWFELHDIWSLCRWFIYNYEEQYWQGLDRARAMRDMINAGETDSKNLEKYLQKYDKKSKK